MISTTKILLALIITMFKYILDLRKQNKILHNNNLGLGQALVVCGGMTQEQYEKSLKKGVESDR